VIKILSLFKIIVIFAWLLMVDTVSHNINNCNCLCLSDLNPLLVERNVGLCQNILKDISEVTGILLKKSYFRPLFRRGRRQLTQRSAFAVHPFKHGFRTPHWCAFQRKTIIS